MVAHGYLRAVLLLQVASYRARTRERFLEETCRKAGLAARDWTNPETRLFAFEAVVFREADFQPVLKDIPGGCSNKQ
jgi:AMMECR1 domain-containing protein